MFGALAVDPFKVSSAQKAGWLAFDATFPTVYAQADVVSRAIDKLRAEPAAAGLASAEAAAKVQVDRGIEAAHAAWLNIQLAKQADALGILSPMQAYRGRVPEFTTAWKNAMHQANHWIRVVYLQDLERQRLIVVDSIQAGLDAARKREIQAAAEASAAGATAEKVAAETNIQAIEKQQEQLLAQTDLEALAKQIAAPKIFGVPVAALVTVAALGTGGWFGFKWWKKRKASKAAPMAGYRRRSRR